MSASAVIESILTEGEISQSLVLLIQAMVELVLVLLLGHSDAQNTINKETIIINISVFKEEI